MKLEYAKRIVEKAECGELTLHEEYSGRCMYGRSTAGVSGDSGDFHAAALEVLREVIEEAVELEEKTSVDPCVWDFADAAKDAAEEFVEAVFCATTDNMGLGTIWY
jgi:hypothetical protein